MHELKKNIEQFIADQKWIFAKTFAKTWPHEYIVEEQVDGKLFAALAKHIDSHGYKSDFYDTIQTYFDYADHTYWHMGNIINRCLESETYSMRKSASRFPEDLIENPQ